MADGLTVSEVALQQGVSVQTVRAWIQEGAPTVRKGRVGGPGALLDAARMPWWLHRRQSSGRTTGEILAGTELPCGGNPFRWMVERHFHCTIDGLGIGLRTFYDSKDWQKIGINLTDTQARALVWRIFQVVVLHLSVKIYEVFDTELDCETGSDLDGWASALLKGNFRTAWTNTDALYPPDAITELAPTGNFLPIKDADT